MAGTRAAAARQPSRNLKAGSGGRVTSRTGTAGDSEMGRGPGRPAQSPKSETNGAIMQRALPSSPSGGRGAPPEPLGDSRLLLFTVSLIIHSETRSASPQLRFPLLKCPSRSHFGCFFMSRVSTLLFSLYFFCYANKRSIYDV